MNRNIQMLISKLAPYDANLTRLCYILDPASDQIKERIRNSGNIRVPNGYNIREWKTFNLRQMHLGSYNSSYKALNNHFFHKSTSRPEDDVCVVIPTSLWNELMAYSPLDRPFPRFKVPFGEVRSEKELLEQAVNHTLLHTTARKSILTAVNEVAILNSTRSFHDNLISWLHILSMITELPADFTKRVKHAGFYERNFAENNYFNYLLFFMLDRNIGRVERLWEVFAKHITERIRWKATPPADMIDILRRVFFIKICGILAGRDRTTLGSHVSKCKNIIGLSAYIENAYYVRHIAEVINTPAFFVEFNALVKSLFNGVEQDFLMHGRYLPVVTSVSAAKVMTIKKLIVKGIK